MKKTFLTMLIAAISYCSYSQSIFPTDGSNVGIGTTSPSYPLTLNSVGETGILTVDGGTSVYLSHGGWGMGAGKLGIGNGTNPTLVVSANANGGSSVGNVGIGTRSPSYPLTLNSAGETGILTVDGGSSIYLSHGGWGMGAGKLGIGNGTNPTLVVSANANGGSSAGNVGIGTVSPSYPLTINNTTSAHIDLTGGASQNGILFEPVSSANQFYLYNGNSNANPGFGLYDNTTAAWRMWINNSGNIGIGMTSPTVPLQFGNAGSFPYPIVGLYDGGTSVKYGLGINLSGGIDGSGGLITYTGDRGFIIRNDNIVGTENFSVDHTGDTYIRGNVGIGTKTPDTKLAVLGTIHANEVKVDLSVPGPDYVFDTDYKLTGLSELKAYVAKNHHLPEIPSAKQMAKDGLNLGDMNTKLLKKVEELTLYLIEKDNQDKKKNTLLSSQQEQINQLKEQLNQITKALTKN